MKSKSLPLPKRSKRWFAWNPNIGIYWEANGETACEVRVAVRRLLYAGDSRPWDKLSQEGWSEVEMQCSPVQCRQIISHKGGKKIYMGTLWPKPINADMTDNRKVAPQ